MKDSLFNACKRVMWNGKSSTESIGGHDIGIEYYTQKDIDNNVPLGNSNQGNIVLVVDDEITIPSGKVLTPSSPKKSLVIMCNRFVNNGSVSMYAKAPNVLPHDYFILGKSDGFSEDVIIPAYANNAIIYTVMDGKRGTQGINGNNGTNRQCGSGGTGGFYCDGGGSTWMFDSGSGYAFGGGAGSATRYYGFITDANAKKLYDVDKTYPMRGGVIPSTVSTGNGNICGVGNPIVSTYGVNQNFGCGGRVIIFCCEFENNGYIDANGVRSNLSDRRTAGASGGGAIDIFYTTLVNRGNLLADGGVNPASTLVLGGNGGNGSITTSKWSKSIVVKPQSKKFSQENWAYLFGQFVTRYGEGE